MAFWLQGQTSNVLLNIVNLFLLKCLQSYSVHLVFCCFIIHLDQSLCGTNFPWYQLAWDVGCSIFRWNPDTANTNISPFCCSQADTFSRTTSNHDLRATAERRLLDIGTYGIITQLPSALDPFTLELKGAVWKVLTRNMSKTSLWFKSVKMGDAKFIKYTGCFFNWYSP